jgi:hypothetical protein
MSAKSAIEKLQQITRKRKHKGVSTDKARG